MTHTLFSSVGLPPAQIDNLASLGYLHMTPIQALSLPAALAGKDLIAQAKTGSGKTAAFALPLLTKLNPRDFGTQALVLCPTRELATQVATEIRRLARYQPNIKVVTLCGGVSIGPQIGSLEHGAHIVVGTPGRIKDHLSKETLSLARTSTVVLDEADRMLEMGFIDDMVSILEETPTDRQTLLFSATYPKDIAAISARFQHSPVQIAVEASDDDNTIEQKMFVCSKQQRLDGLVKLLTHFKPHTAVIFCNTKLLVRDVGEHLNACGIYTAVLHGDLEQRDRDHVLVQFRQQSCRILVATDVAARGLDIDDLAAVINFELPHDSETYVHRIGRTGRAGKSGLALTLFTEAERFKIERITNYLKYDIPFVSLETLPMSDTRLPAPEFLTLCIAGGRKAKVRPGDILGALTGPGGVDGKAVGKIDINDHAAFVAIQRNLADKALTCLQEGKIKGRKFRVTKM